MYEISTIVPNIEVHGKSEVEVRKVVVKFLQNVPLCEEDSSRCHHPDSEDHAGPCCLIQLGEHSSLYLSRVSGKIVVLPG